MERAMTGCPACEHDWEDCGFLRTFTGVKWRHVAAVFFCPNCRRFGSRTRTMMDGRFCKPEELQGIREAETADYLQQRAAWLKQHYPDLIEDRHRR